MELVMNVISAEEIEEYVAQNIDRFHDKRSESLTKLKLDTVLKRKNPYLYKAKNISLASDFVTSILDAYLSSQEETIFGEFLEGLAIFICNRTYGGSKSSSVGIDLDFVRNNIRYLVSIKSGPNWGNSSQINKMRDCFKTAKKVLKTNSTDQNVVAINGCCYGKDDRPDKGDYLKLCGQRFWEFISGSATLYLDIIEPLGYKAKVKNTQFKKKYSKQINLFTAEFIRDFCTEGEIDWEKIVSFNSASRNFSS
jgi:hypothetical protein